MEEYEILLLNRVNENSLEFLNFIRALDEYMKKLIPENKDYKFSARVLKKYVRVTFAYKGHDYGVFCFIEIETGDILKSGSYYQPQPNGKRGNLYKGPFPLTSKSFYIR